MNNISKIKINSLVDKLYLESVANKIYETVDDGFDWIRDINPQPIDISKFNGVEYWIDMSMLTSDEKIKISNYIDDLGLYEYDHHKIKKDPKTYNGIVLHCGDEEHDYEPTPFITCIMPFRYEKDDKVSDYTVYVDGNIILTQIDLTINENKIINGLIDDLKLSSKFIFSFGTGIGALMNPVKELLNGSGLNFTDTEINLLIITAIATILNDVNLGKLVDELKEKGLHGYLKNVVDFILNVKKIIDVVTKKSLNVVYSLTDILGFTFILVPVMKIITDLINDYGLTFESYSQLLTGLLSSVVSYSVKNIVKGKTTN